MNTGPFGGQVGSGRSVMVHQFSQSPAANIQRSSFDRSHGLKTTFNETNLVPVYIDEALPGDTFTLRTTAFGRLSTPIYPVMDNLYLDFFFFFVPYRLVWTHFVNFFGEQANPTDTTSYLVPTVSIPAGSWVSSGLNTLADNFGIPVNSAAVGPLVVNSLPFRAYNLIWNQWFRDENLQNSVVVELDDGPDTAANYAILPRGKRKDYFTSCLPFPQKGPSTTIPIAGTPNIQTIGGALVTGAAPPLLWNNATTGAAITTSQSLGTLASTSPAGGTAAYATAPAGATTPAYPSNLYVNLGTATNATINQLRQAFQVQKLYERDARGGTRYIELIKAHFGVTSPDARLQRAEYLGGGSVSININPIAQTSATGASGTNTPLGNLSGMGTVHTHGAVGFSKSFTEHGVVMGLVNLRADINYQDGLDRMWSRSTRFDFYWPAFSHIGEQGVLNQEIWAVGNGASGDTLVFGYQERYAEYRYKPSKVCGAFRSSSPAPLDAWHLAQHFSSLPVLNAAFIQDAPPIPRIVAVTTGPHVLLDCYFSLRCARPMPVYSVPGLVDHF